MSAPFDSRTNNHFASMLPTPYMEGREAFVRRHATRKPVNPGWHPGKTTLFGHFARSWDWTKQPHDEVAEEDFLQYQTDMVNAALLSVPPPDAKPGRTNEEYVEAWLVRATLRQYSFNGMAKT